jgi:flagellar basal-body rod protein FlgB
MDPLLSTVEYAMSGLQLRLDTIANNVANANTPNFRSSRVDFETNLAKALRAGDGAPEGAAQVVPGEDLADNAGTSVSLENELTDMTKSSIERQIMVSSFNYKIDVLKNAAGAR